MLLMPMLLFGGLDTLRPDADSLTGNWSPTPLWSSIDEATQGYDSIATPSNQNPTGEVFMDNPSEEGTYSIIKVNVYARKHASGGNTRGLDADIRVNGVLQGNKTLSSDLSSSWTEYSVSWTGLSLDSADVASLHVKFTSTGTTGGSPANRRRVEIDMLFCPLTYLAGGGIGNWKYDGYIF
jgi:hypothetical protein